MNREDDDHKDCITIAEFTLSEEDAILTMEDYDELILNQYDVVTEELNHLTELLKIRKERWGE